MTTLIAIYVILATASLTVLGGWWMIVQVKQAFIDWRTGRAFRKAYLEAKAETVQFLLGSDTYLAGRLRDLRDQAENN